MGSTLSGDRIVGLWAIRLSSFLFTRKARWKRRRFDTLKKSLHNFYSPGCLGLMGVYVYLPGLIALASPSKEENVFLIMEQLSG